MYADKITQDNQVLQTELPIVDNFSFLCISYKIILCKP